MVFHRAGVTVAIALVLAQYVAEGAHTSCRVEKSIIKEFVLIFQKLAKYMMGL